jgi:hypothetical protein
MGQDVSTALDHVNSTIAERVIDLWETDLSNDPARIKWPNVDFTQPSGSTWLRVTIIPGRATPRTYGPTSDQIRASVLLLECFAPKNAGRQVTRTFAEKALDKFVGKAVKGLSFQDNRVDYFENEPAWDRVMVTLEFTQFETVTTAIIL